MSRECERAILELPRHGTAKLEAKGNKSMLKMTMLHFTRQLL